MKKKTIIGLTLSSLILVAGLGTYIQNEFYSKHLEEKVEENELQVELEKSHGMTINKLNSVTNTDGSITQSFSYTIYPDNATDKSVSISFYTNNEYSNSNYFTFSTNKTTQIISITCKQAFDKQIRLKIYSNQNSVCYSYITLDYEKKITSYSGGEYDGCYICYGSSSDGLADFFDDIVSYDELFEINYSKYSKDKNYTYSLEVVDWFVDENTLSNYPYPQSQLEEKYANLVINAIENNTTITNIQIRNLYQSTAYYMWLSNYYNNGGYIYFEMYISLYCNETNEYLIEDYEYYIGINFEGRSLSG